VNLVRRMLGALALVALATAVLPAAVGAGTQDEPADGEVGVSNDTIRIAVIADVDNAARPGLFEGAVRGVRAGAKYVNEHGGVAGRTIEVDFIDSHLTADDSRSALVQACENDFALVGTSALFMSNVDPMVGCPDGGGRPTGLPDIPLLQTEIAHQCSPVSFPIIVVGIDCDTKDDPKPRFDERVGHYEWFKQHVEDLHGVAVLAGDLKSTVNAFLPNVAVSEKLGVENDGVFKQSALATQAQYGPIVQAIKDSASTYVNFGIDYKADIQLRREAKIQGVTSVKVWDCTLACYDSRFLEEGGADVEGQYMEIFFPPFEEAKSNKSVTNYLKAVGGRDSADAAGAQAYAGVLFFRDVVDAVVKAHGDDGLTRARFLEEAAKIHDFTADGMLGPTDVGGRKVNGCFVLVQVQDGKFVRVFPKRKGTVDCSTKPRSVRVDLE
jgi:Periplasmic binding protein